MEGRPLHIQTDNGTRKESHISDVVSVKSRRRTQDFDDNYEGSYKSRKSKIVKFPEDTSSPRKSLTQRDEIKNQKCCTIF
mmetsp:Transcript_7296/g.6460  ORF Transcript_7296/g.6460 Transcript_7296/m.6460 type:complete len:80 (-) Transcript_7296:59-298(-)